MQTYTKCLRSIDFRDSQADEWDNKLSKLSSNLNSESIVLNNYLLRCPDEIISEITSFTEFSRFGFYLKKKRYLKNYLLSDSEESMLVSIRKNAYVAWSDLHKDISGSIKLNYQKNGSICQTGLAQALTDTRCDNSETRKNAWVAIQKAWSDNQLIVAKILNSMVGFRHDIYQKRSHTKKFDYMNEALSTEQLQESTLKAMFSAIENNQDKILEILKTLASIKNSKLNLSKSEPNYYKLNPWDLDSPYPVDNQKIDNADFNSKTDSLIPYESAINMIADAFQNIHPEFSQFVRFMNDSKFIEGRILPNKSPGGYCTDFVRSGTTRIFFTYTGTVSDVITLAHELGHSFHSWMVRDVSFIEKDYTHSLAETASVFAEKVLTDYLIQRSTNRNEKIQMLWNELMRAIAFLINIPARFEFETLINEHRKTGTLTAEKLIELNDQAWTKWYKDSLTENDKMFWAWKGHFYITYKVFYNFPYTFGYLFSLSIYATQKTSGPNFFNNFKNILRDTTCLSAEEIIQKHLGQDISKIDFWEKPILSILKNLEELESLLHS